MPRSSSRSSSPVRAPARPASRPTTSSSTPAARPAPAQTQSKAVAPAPAPAHTPAPAPAAAPMAPAGGMGSGLLGNIASVAAGSVIGHGISNAIWGGSSHHGEGAAPAAAVAQNQAQLEDICQPHRLSFVKCIDDNRDTIAECQRQLDLYNYCKESNKPTLDL
eukprot:TRINITY_DN10705_c0_g1_i1.p2 TRINITY_DN10705_c0_g1~~TRINITY_DN10705_c0_g1_i1.p2  ORF type:complete len:183 (-),score=32.49 TRINITY_DN10705_c0_g1_i1:55-543(-)